MMFKLLLSITVVACAAQQDRDEEAEYTRALRQAREIGKKLTEGLARSPSRIYDPKINEPAELRAWDWQVLQARVALLGVSTRFDYCRFTDTSPTMNSVVGYFDDGGGHLYWVFECPGQFDAEEVQLLSGFILGKVSGAMPDVHVNAHCVVFAMPGDGERELRFVTFDRDSGGNLVRPQISVTRPTASVERRNKIEELFVERAKLRERLEALRQSSTGWSSEDRKEFVAGNARLLEVNSELEGPSILEHLRPTSGGTKTGN